MCLVVYLRVERCAALNHVGHAVDQDVQNDLEEQLLAVQVILFALEENALLFQFMHPVYSDHRSNSKCLQLCQNIIHFMT